MQQTKVVVEEFWGKVSNPSSLRQHSYYDISVETVFTSQNIVLWSKYCFHRNEPLCKNGKSMSVSEEEKACLVADIACPFDSIIDAG